MDTYGIFYILVAVGGFMGALVVCELAVDAVDKLLQWLKERRARYEQHSRNQESQRHSSARPTP